MCASHRRLFRRISQNALVASKALRYSRPRARRRDPRPADFSSPDRGAAILTVFSIPKAFRGHVSITQRNAIASWTKLEPRPEILLLGSDEGTAQVARELGVRHIPEVGCNEHGTPLVREIFHRAERRSPAGVMCYVNADIVLTSDFVWAVARVRKKLNKFLIISKRINLNITEPLRFGAHWESGLKKLGREKGTPGDHTSIDVFVFPKGTYPDMPDFGIGRPWFDQWLIKMARSRNIPVVDVSEAAPIFHQNHDYSHVVGGADRVWRSKEAEDCLRMYGGVEHAFTFLDATHAVSREGVLKRVRLRKPLFALKHGYWGSLVQRTLPVRNKLRLRRKFWQSEKPVLDPAKPASGATKSIGATSAAD